jgi:hypothetical protein
MDLSITYRSLFFFIHVEKTLLHFFGGIMEKNEGPELEQSRRTCMAEINVQPRTRPELEAKYCRVWDTEELKAEFEIIAFVAPYLVIRHRSDGRLASLEFQHVTGDN